MCVRGRETGSREGMGLTKVARPVSRALPITGPGLAHWERDMFCFLMLPGQVRDVASASTTGRGDMCVDEWRCLSARTRFLHIIVDLP